MDNNDDVRIVCMTHSEQRSIGDLTSARYNYQGHENGFRTGSKNHVDVQYSTASKGDVDYLDYQLSTLSLSLILYYQRAGFLGLSELPADFPSGWTQSAIALDCVAPY